MGMSESGLATDNTQHGTMWSRELNQLSSGRCNVTHPCRRTSHRVVYPPEAPTAYSNYHDNHGQANQNPSTETDLHCDLILLDYEIDQHIATFRHTLANGKEAPLDSTVAKNAVGILEAEQRWFEEARHTIDLLTNGSQESAVLEMRNAMIDRLVEDVLPLVESSLQSFSATSMPHEPDLKIIDTSEC